MISYDEQYYIVMKPDFEDYPRLIATNHTASRKYKFDPLPMFSEPLAFYNSKVVDNPDDPIKYTAYPMLKTGTSFLVIEQIKEHFTDFYNLKGMRLHPAIYISTDDEVYENYWFLNIYTKIDCWSRDKSEFDAYRGEDKPPLIEKYSLDSSILDGINEDDRLIFRMGHDSSNNLFVHQRIIDYFESANVTGYRAFKVSEYEFGMEFRP